MPAVKVKSAEIRQDGWTNLFTGLGIQNRDKRLNTEFQITNLLTEAELVNMYREDGFCRRIVDLPPEEMIRQGWEIEGDPDGMVNARLQELRFNTELKKALCWMRLFGGGLIVMGIDDGAADMSKPVNENGIRNVIFLKTYDRHRATWSTANLYQNPLNPKFNQVETYMISPVTGVAFTVHETRVLKFDGMVLPDLAWYANQGWGDSVIQNTYTQIRALGSVYDNTEHIIQDFVQGVLTMQNLQELIASGKEALVQKRLNLIDLSRHVINTTLLDEREKFEKHSSTVTGLPDLIDRYQQALSSVTGIPVTLLFGRSPGGLNSTGDSDIRMWYDKMSAEQETTIGPALEILTRYIFKSKDYYFRGREPANWEIKFNPLWQQDEKQVAETRKITAETDAIYITNSVITPEEVATTRFGGEEYNAGQIELQHTGPIEPPEPNESTLEEEGEEEIPNKSTLVKAE